MSRHTIAKISVRGAAQRARTLRGAGRQLQDDLHAEIRELGMIAEAAMQEHALEDTSHMKSTIRAIQSFRASRPSVRIEIDATRDGFDYLRATRKGQDTDPIRPKDASVLAVRLHGRFGPIVGMSQVSAFRPASDWVEDAGRDVDPEVDRSTDALGRRFERRIRL